MQSPEPGDGLEFVRVAAGMNHTALLRSDGRALAVGYNYFGQCDLPEPKDGIAFVQVSAAMGAPWLLGPIVMASATSPSPRDRG